MGENGARMGREWGEDGAKENAMATSIIILTFNKLEFTKKCIESIRKYTKNQSYEIIVVDNNSTDGTVEYLKSQTNLKVIYNKQNVGFPKGCNLGIGISKKENDILLLNNDTIVTSNYLENLNKCLNSDECIGAVGPVTNSSPYYQAVDVKFENSDQMQEIAKNINISNKELWEERQKLIGFCMIIKREALEKVGLLDEEFSPGNYEDDDYSIRLIKNGYRLILAKDTFIYHYGGASFENNNKYISILQKNEKKFKEKWGFTSKESMNIYSQYLQFIEGENPKILEAYCGTGATAQFINQNYKCRYYGLDDNINALSIARINKIEQTDEFDYIIISDVSRYLSDQSVIQIVHNLFKSNTKLLINFKKDEDNENTINKICNTFGNKTFIVVDEVNTINRCFLLLSEAGKEEYPVVSILIPTYNRPKYFKIALESAINQTYPNIEIIIGDDSTDNQTENLVNEYINKFENIKYYHNRKNLGQFDNDLKLINLASGEYINFLMDDDVFEKNKIATMMKYFIEDSEGTLSVVSSNRKLIDKNGNFIKNFISDEDSPYVTDFKCDGMKTAEIICKFNWNLIGEPTTPLFRKSKLTENFGVYNNRRFICNVDMASWYTLLKNGDCIILSEPLSSFRIHKGQQLRDEKNIIGGIEDYTFVILNAKKNNMLKDNIEYLKAIEECVSYAEKCIKKVKNDRIIKQCIIKLKEEYAKVFNAIFDNKL